MTDEKFLPSRAELWTATKGWFGLPLLLLLIAVVALPIFLVWCLSWTWTSIGTTWH